MVTEVAKTASIGKTTEMCVKYTIGRPTPPHTNPIESGPRHTFFGSKSKKRKTKSFMISYTKKRHPWNPR